jgi:cephalosporin hydroxylase
MKIEIDLEKSEVVVESEGSKRALPLGSPEAFSAISWAWLRAGWDTKYVYSFTWLGRPVIQLPEDLIRIQEVIFRVKPDVIIETGIAHGGSLVFYASLCRAMGQGRVIGVDIEIRPHNRKAIEAHDLYSYIEMIEGDSISHKIVETVHSMISTGETVIVVLDSHHSRDHVLGELRAYAPLVSVGSYIVACDGIMRDLVGAPRTGEDWSWNNPLSAIDEFTREDDRFIVEEPAFPFNEGEITERVSYWPQAFLRRVKP